MKNYFTEKSIGENLDIKTANMLLRAQHNGKIKRTAKINGVDILDLEGFDFKQLKGLKNCGHVSMIIILSYYLSHGYVMDETGCLRKNLENDMKHGNDDISEETLLSAILSEKTTEELKGKGIIKVSDLIGKSYRDVMGDEYNDKNVKQWFEIEGKLAGHGYDFYSSYNRLDTKSSIIGMIRKAPIEYFPNMLLSETEKKDQEENVKCSSCSIIKELETSLRELNQEMEEAIAKIMAIKNEIISERNNIIQLEKEIEHLRKENEMLRTDNERLKSITALDGPYLK